MNDRERQKRSEIAVAMQAANYLGEVWDLTAREEPDFMVSSVSGRFGLEVTECQVGPKGKGGSKLREKESFNENWLRDIRSRFERSAPIGIRLQYSGSVTTEAADELLTELLSFDFENTKVFGPQRIELRSGKAWVWLSRAESWTYIDDRVGWVCEDGAFLQREIDSKARKLKRYRKACADVRLLVVADRIYNSGKLRLPDGYRPDLLGFNAVYFFSYPEEIIPFYLDARDQ